MVNFYTVIYTSVIQFSLRVIEHLIAEQFSAITVDVQLFGVTQRSNLTKYYLSVVKDVKMCSNVRFQFYRLVSNSESSQFCLNKFENQSQNLRTMQDPHMLASNVPEEIYVATFIGRSTKINNFQPFGEESTCIVYLCIIMKKGVPIISYRQKFLPQISVSENISCRFFGNICTFQRNIKNRR
eukprot:TRINITY_DN2124_c0_g1_i15.p1 TRINITY_DN2124_c0_g1~~TRINITY_DN2124_c0_g1_i15.p1  ORF type:complete len:183 (-),score=0.44 TRINITY_DN2124_c0_g1_i15:86-634(-)